MQIKTLPIDSVKPYWRNPRRITPSAVQSVADSIDRYGYQQPIVVDRKHVVIVGHTRLMALRRLGVTDVPVIVADLPPKKAKEYRLADNRTNELTSWDTDMLTLELADLGLADYFPSINTSRAVPLPEEQSDREGPLVVVCPWCYESVTVPEGV